ncbi:MULTISPECIES: STM4012 family radical SAM protein [unclassified Janthinobacterium]|uniref:STM4012 family radical SAM protein n=1 Tax=unclassified Janthinobacterium TaxID=2610881 RepID=UPI00183C1481|nr:MULTISPECIES: STM4012 family radical SAM protein [unclassified Janthinobacterium]MBB5369914.1 oxygen-independent coproporphyrinogen-3 oxidase [Janthinobacterium sp. K2C7]MBB5382720.1 oxygen-independent coproporphyrinogen-3 oxidase [Janthinobacterium sp. K2Li3]MBB5384705.1 oxygen-independent coproporphyrinogen-3 oxidase [Janthinobacterium sp. K2E3]
MNPSEQTLAQRMRHTPYQAYSYSYPHKAAYRSLVQAAPLAPLWAQQDRSALFAYIHIPFCEMRCGFCNLFAMARPSAGMVERYVQQVLLQMRALNGALGERRFARFALGGGTPTYLSAAQLDALLCGARDILGIDLQQTPAGIEASPETITAERLAVCRAHGIDRVSLGIQSFAAGEMRALARPQQNATVHHAIGLIREAGFPTLNLDLIYGIAGQTVDSLLASIDSALAFKPEELYLYPLYVREQTGLGKVARRQGAATLNPIMLARDGDSRLALYAAARDHLRTRGYEQVSMRMFRAPHAPEQNGPSYCCQNDGMVGLGAGARSYTTGLHYSSQYAVERTQTIGIIEQYLTLDEAQFAQAEHGYVLDEAEQQRRYVIQSLLTEPGLDRDAYTARFGTYCEADLPQLAELHALELVEEDGRLLRLNQQGYAYADTIGPWLASDTVRALMAEGGQAC